MESTLNKLLEWEYHFNSKKHGKRWSKEANFKYSTTSLASKIALLYFTPILFIVVSLFIYILDYPFKVNKHIGAIPFGVLFLVFHFLLKRKLVASDFRNMIMSSEFNQSSAKKMSYLGLVGILLLLIAMAFSVRLLLYVNFG